MYVIGDDGQGMVNGDNVYSFGIVASQTAFALVAFSTAANQNGPIFTPLVIGSKERCEQALAAVRKGIKDRALIVDLLGLLGQRPDLTVASPQIIRPGNGDGRS